MVRNFEASGFSFASWGEGGGREQGGLCYLYSRLFLCVVLS